MNTKKLIESRKNKGWTQEKLAQKSNFSRNSIGNWERGKYEPKIKDIEKLAKTLEISPNELLENSHQEDIDLKKRPEPYQNMAYWGEVVDNIRKVLANGDIHEITMIEPLIKSGYELLVIGKTQVQQNKKDTVKQHIDIRNNGLQENNINFGTISTKEKKQKRK